MRAIALTLGLALTAGGAAAGPSGYAGEETRAVKALSAEEVADLLAGRGMGLAKAAELNHHPGPMHALDLADELDLTPDQRAALEASRARMAEAARRLGAELVGEEQALDAAFAAASLTPADLAARTDRLGDLQGRLRAAHLLAHLETRAVLDDEQVGRYDRLRGYVAGDSPEAHGQGHGPAHDRPR